MSSVTGLTSISIPDSVPEIESRSSHGCTSLTSVFLGRGVTSISLDAFAYCAGLTAIEVDDLNPAYSSLDGVLFDHDRTKLILFPESKTGDYSIPSSVTFIDSDAFSGSTGLTSVTIGHGVAFIYHNAFTGCTGLTSITIPDSVTDIGRSAFGRCSASPQFPLVTASNTVMRMRSPAALG